MYFTKKISLNHMSFRASHLKSILDHLGQEEYTRIVNAARYNDQTQLGQLVSEMDPRDFDFAIHFVNKIKERFNNNVSIYKQFLDILSTYRRDKRTIVSIYNKVKTLFSSQPDLFEEFQKFLPDPTLGTQPVQEEDIQLQSSFVSPEEVAFFDRVQVLLGSKTVYEEFLKVINLYNQDIINKNILVERVAYFLQKSPELFSWFCNYVNFKPQDNIRRIVNQFHTKGITLDEPFSSVSVKQHFDKDHLGLGRKDVQLWKVSGSYRLMPESEKKSPSSGRDPLSNSVLNDTWVSHPTWASEDENFSVHRKNIHEETLHRTEDEKFELDMKILTNDVAIRVLDAIFKDVSAMSEEDKKVFELKEDDFPTTLYKKAVRQIYDDVRGDEMINAIQKKPSIALPIVLHKLKMKHEEWQKDRRDHDRAWRDNFKKSFWKALDYQGANFKLQDKKFFTPKTLFLEIEELHASKQKLFKNKSIPELQADLTLDFDDDTILKCVIFFTNLFKRSLSTTEYKKFEEFVNLFLLPLFNCPIDDPYDLYNPSEMKDDTEDLEMPDTLGDVFFLPSAFYLSLKLIHLLFVRIKELKKSNEALIKDPPKAPNKEAVLLSYACVPNPTEQIHGDRYEYIITQLYQYVQTFQDQNTFEENCRKCFGLDGYKVFTVDRILQTLAKAVTNIYLGHSII
eukprot:NODE_57_length_28844_cov_0.352687.p3 type:complete len:679 gc:universal NODE_57_length_28844_cov_0.352687:20400-22436(+)